MNRKRLLATTCLGTLLAACAVNPVTGQRHLQFYDIAWEQEMGASYYAPLRQQQGGDFVLDPELTAYVQSVGSRLARHARRADQLSFEFNIVNDSTPNAWALPGGKISVHRGLLTELESEAELAAVLGHEIVHADAAHTARQQSKGVLTQVGAVAGMVLIGSQAESSAGKAAAVLLPAMGAQLLTQKYSRDAEREADQFGMQYMSESGYDPAGAVELQETFVRLSEGRRQDWLSGLFASHPPSRERVESNRNTAAALPAGGESGRERYQQRIASLKRVQPAYEAYDHALKLTRDKDYTGARKELNQALASEPRESLFHALDGDLQDIAGNQEAAVAAYERAVGLNQGYFLHYLRRGELYLARGRSSDARRDLQRSLDLLPTAQAHYLLGNLDRDAGQTASAARHYEQAAKSDSEAGRMAQRERVLLDIRSNPGKYVASEPAADGEGRIFCLLGNRTSMDLVGISVTAQWRDDDGMMRSTEKTLSGALAGNGQAQLDTGWRTTEGALLGQRATCTVTTARIAD